MNKLKMDEQNDNIDFIFYDLTISTKSDYSSKPIPFKISLISSSKELSLPINGNPNRIEL